MRIPPQIEYYTRINKEICEVFAERLKALKDERNMTLEGIADIIGTSRQSVVYYTMGDRLPSIPGSYKHNDNVRDVGRLSSWNQQRKTIGYIMNDLERRFAF